MQFDLEVVKRRSVLAANCRFVRMTHIRLDVPRLHLGKPVTYASSDDVPKEPAGHSVFSLVCEKRKVSGPDALPEFLDGFWFKLLRTRLEGLEHTAPDIRTAYGMIPKAVRGTGLVVISTEPLGWEPMGAKNIVVPQAEGHPIMVSHPFAVVVGVLEHLDEFDDGQVGVYAAANIEGDRYGIALTGPVLASDVR